MDMTRRYAPWVGGGLLAIAAFTGLVAERFAVPLVFFVLGAGLLIYTYWDSIKSFDMWALDEWARSRAHSVGIREWYAPYHAVEHFCDPKIIMARNMAAAEMNTLMMELIKNSEGGGSRHVAYEAARVRHDQTNAILARDLQRMLAHGQLIAKGLPIENDSTRAERPIPVAQWRVLTLNLSKAEAYGPGWHYSGIVVGKKAGA